MASRPLLLCLLALVVAGCGEEEQAAAPDPARIDLVVRVDDDGPDGPEPARRARVRCSRGDPARACRAAEALAPDDFAPVDPMTACTEIFGGPQTATVTGRLRGARVDARFSRANGCEIARWERVAKLLARVR